MEQTEQHGTNAPLTKLYSYVGLTSNVSQEEHKSGTSTTTTKTYSYDAFGTLSGMADTAKGEQYTYALDVHGSVSMLLDKAGNADASYGYEPYGEQVSGLTQGDTDQDNPLNPYRYTQKRYDSGSNTYDMGARRFAPDTARFLQLDVYSGALADLGLSLDPLTQNRYALAGGNPISYVEVDGHWFHEDGIGAEEGHTALDALGLIPGLGEIADGANCLWYGAEGDAVNAGLSCAAMVPLAGTAATAAKWGIKYGDEVVPLSDEALAKMDEAVSGTCSFSADTVVATPDGEKPISELEVGDTVLAWDEETGEVGEYEVTATFSHEDRVIEYLTVDGERLVITPEQPF